MSDIGRKRVTVKHKHPNPLFEQWLIEWRDKAKEKESKMQYCFQLALTTLRKYPLPLESGKDCKILKGFGEKLCRMLDDKLKEYKAGNRNVNECRVQPVNNVQVNPSSVKGKRKSVGKNSSRDYIPQHGSGAFAILVTLYENSLEPGYPGFLTKSEIVAKGQHLCNVSFTKPGPDTRYTGWSSMKVLLEKNLVTKQGNPAKFSLTDEGITLADKLYIQQKIEDFKKEEENEVPPLCPNIGNKESKLIVKDKLSQPSCSGLGTKKTQGKGPLVKKSSPIFRQTSTASTASTQSSTAHETVLLEPGSFEIILLVDTQELNGSKGDAEKDPIIVDLKNLNVQHEVRNLKVGDYTWICRDKVGNEIILPYIIERKRMDDFGSSIKDSRFHEQKFRLKQCGIPNLIYLIESYGKNEHVGLPVNTLYQAATNTLIHDGFTVKFTENGKASCEYLACLTKFLEDIFKAKTLASCPKEDLPQLELEDDLISLMLFKDFNKSSAKSKHFKVKEMFVRQLLQIKGMSVDKALAIVEKYPTPKLLKLSYSELDETKGQKMLSNIQYGALKKNVGLVLTINLHIFKLGAFCNAEVAVYVIDNLKSGKPNLKDKVST